MLTVIAVLMFLMFFESVVLNARLSRIASAIDAQNVHYGITGVRTTREVAMAEARGSGRGSVSYVRGFKGSDGQWYYQPRGANNQTLSTSEGYTRREDALKAATDAYPALSADEFKFEDA